MSYSSVCQGLHSCLEPRLIEPRVLKLKLASPGSNLSRTPEWPSSSSTNSSSSSSHSFSDFETYEKPLPNTATTNDGHDTKSEAGGCFWSFLQSVSNISHCNKIEGPEAENIYVHPAVKCSSSVLSARSLELCTESLGCETGSKNASDSTDDMSLFSFEYSSSFTRSTLVNKKSGSKRLNRGSSSLPPPLTSITDLGRFQVRSHREDGRLILEAVASSSPQLYAERGNGRLRLQLVESVASYCGGGDDDDDEGEAEILNQEASGEEDAGPEEELEEYVRNAEDATGMTKFARPSGCKESGNRDILGNGYVELPSLSVCL